MIIKIGLEMPEIWVHYAHFQISEMEEKRKNEPPPKVGPISKQIAAKAKLRSGIIKKSLYIRKITLIKMTCMIYFSRIQSFDG